tara:strand:+ start:32133 stop:32366 length:234 start_codon:yes stop_codon:yes gene_type:complete
MKDKIYFYIAATTLVLITATIMASMNVSFSWVFYATILGQVLLVVMVYKILKDNYSTTKTFDDFYEDHPISQQENYR